MDNKHKPKINNSGWVCLSFTGATWKPHVLPAKWRHLLVSDLRRRDPGPAVSGKLEIAAKPTTEIFLDLRDPCYADAPDETVDCYGLSVSMPSEFVATFAQDLERAPLRHFQVGRGRVSYYKLHSGYGCLVLSEGQRNDLLIKLQNLTSNAEERARAFYESKKPINQVLAEANQVATGAACRPEDVGIDPHKRYRPNYIPN